MQIPYRLMTAMIIGLLCGCSSIDTLTRKQAETEGRLEQILQTTVAQRAEIAELSRQLEAMEKKFAVVETASVSLAKEIEVLRTQAAAKKTADPPLPVPPTIAVVNSEGGKPDRESVQQEAYMNAFGMYSSSRYDDAIISFTEFITAYPDSEYAANAQYWIGECHYSRNDYKKSLESFNTVISRYPKGKKVPDAMLKAAFSHLGMGDPESARAIMLKLIDAYPKSPAAAKAGQKLSNPL